MTDHSKKFASEMDADADRDANSGAATAVGERSSSIQNAEARR